MEGDEEEPFCFGSRKGHSNVPQIPFPSTRSVVLENIQTTFKGGLFALFFFSPLLIFCFLFKEPLRISLMSIYQRCAVCFPEVKLLLVFEAGTDRLRPSVGRQPSPLLWALSD